MEKTYEDGWFEAMHFIHSAIKESPHMSSFDVAEIAFENRVKKKDLTPPQPS